MAPEEYVQGLRRANEAFQTIIMGPPHQDPRTLLTESMAPSAYESQRFSRGGDSVDDSSQSSDGDRASYDSQDEDDEYHRPGSGQDGVGSEDHRVSATASRSAVFQLPTKPSRTVSRSLRGRSAQDAGLSVSVSQSLQQAAGPYVESIAVILYKVRFHNSLPHILTKRCRRNLRIARLQTDKACVYVMPQTFVPFCETLGLVFPHLALSDVMRCRAVCRTWKDAATDTIRHRHVVGVEPGLEQYVRHRSLEGLIKLAPRIRDLNLSFCSKLSHVDGLTGLSKLRRLFLQNCIRLRKVDALSMVSNLVQLDLRSCVKLSSLNPLATLKELKLLEISHCPRITDIQALSLLTKLTDFTASYCSGVQDWTYLSLCTSLLRVDISGSEATSIAFAHQLIKLEELSILGCLNLESIEPLQSHPSLQVLEANACPSVSSWKPLLSVTKIRTVHLDVDSVADEEIQTVRKLLETLSLGNP